MLLVTISSFEEGLVNIEVCLFDEAIGVRVVSTDLNVVDILL